MDKKLQHVLLIDDDDATNFLHEFILRTFNSNLKITIAEDGKKAIDFLSSLDNDEVPDLILLDINMPVMNGWEFLEEYKKLNKKFKKNIIACMVTTSLNPDDYARAQHINEINSFISKPLTEETIIELNTFYFENPKTLR